MSFICTFLSALLILDWVCPRGQQLNILLSSLVNAKYVYKLLLKPTCNANENVNVRNSSIFLTDYGCQNKGTYHYSSSHDTYFKVAIKKV